MRARRLAFLLFLAVAAAAPAGMKVEVDADPACDFSKFKTYAWAAPPPSVPAVTHERIVAAVDRELASRGMVPAGKDPDLLLTYDASAAEEFEPAEIVAGYGHASFSGVGWYEKPEKRYRKGTLVLRIADARQGKLVWQGSASEAIEETPEKNAKKVDKAVRKLLDKLPAGRR